MLNDPPAVRLAWPLPSGTTVAPPEGCWRFGRFELQRQERRLLADGAAVALGARALDLLIVLAENAGRLLTREQLLDRVWPGRVVEENNLSVQINALRKALGSDVVATVPGHGYRFVARIDNAMAAPAAAPAVLVAAPRQRTHLPQRLAPLIGRGDDLAALQTLVDREPLVCITGAGGMGKTLLAQTLLQARRDAYAHGVCFVDLAPLERADEVPAAIATALGLTWTGAEDPVAALARAVSALQMLVVLDNAEHLVEVVADTVQVLRAGAPEMRWLVTSQVRLKLAGEWVFRLAPLTVPPRASAAVAALSYGAVALFVERARAIDHGFRLDEGNVASVIDLCRCLDGTALAIELAVARLPLLGLAGLMQSLAEPLQVLTQGRRDAPARQRTLRAAIAWSHGLLGPVEQIVFRRLAVFVGGVGLGMVAQVLTDDTGHPRSGVDEWAVLDALGALVDRSLVVMSTADDEAEPRYRLLDSPLALAREQLLASGEGPRLQARHAHALRQRLDQAHDRLLDGAIGADEFADGLEPDLDNAQAALRWALAHDATLAVALAPVLSAVLGRRRYAQGVALWSAVEPLLDDPGCVLAPLLRGRALLQCAEHWQNTRIQHARQRASQAEALARATGDVRLQYLAQRILGYTGFRTGDRAALVASAEAARALERAHWSPWVRVVRPGTEAFLCMLDGDHEGAVRWCEQQAALTRAAGASDTAVLVKIVGAQMRAGRIDECIASARDLAERLAGSLEQQQRCFALSNLSAALLMRDRVAEARAVLAQSWPLCVRYGLQPEWADDAALLAALERRPRAALRLLGATDASLAAQGRPREPEDQARADRAQALAIDTLGAMPWSALKTQGAQFSEAELLAHGLALEDAEA